MRFDRILSLSLFSNNPKNLQQFYEGALDLPFGHSTDSSITMYGGDTALNVLLADDETRDQVGRDTGITLRVRGEGDLKRHLARISDRGFNVSSAGPWRDGFRAHVKDPEGNGLTLWETQLSMDDLHYYDGPSSVTVKVRDLRKSLQFYLAQLELPMLDQPDAKTAILFPGGTNLILTEDGRWPPAEPIRGETGICLLADDPYSIVDMLKGKLVPFAEGPKETASSIAATLRDPDGNRITFIGQL